MLVLLLCFRLLVLYSDHLQAFLNLLQLPSFLFGSRRITSHSPLSAKQRLPFALLNLHMAIIISNEKSANSNLKELLFSRMNAGSSWASRAAAEPVSQELSCLAGQFTCLMFLLVLHHKIKTFHLSNIFLFWDASRTHTARPFETQLCF